MDEGNQAKPEGTDLLERMKKWVADHPDYWDKLKDGAKFEFEISGRIVGLFKEGGIMNVGDELEKPDARLYLKLPVMEKLMAATDIEAFGKLLKLHIKEPPSEEEKITFDVFSKLAALRKGYLWWAKKVGVPLV